MSPTSVNKFVDSFVESAIIAGLAEAAEGKVILVETPEQDLLNDPITPEPAAPPTAPQRHQTQQRAATPVVQQVWDIADGMIMFEIRSEKPLPASVFATVGEVVASLERLARTLAAPASASSDSDASS